MKDHYLRRGIYRERKKLKPPYAEIMEIQSEISSILKDIRKESGLSQREMAEHTSLSARTLWKIENGASVNLESILKLLFVLDYQITIKEVP
jgi:DNA-binding XRE family transcriptional regulator